MTIQDFTNTLERETGFKFYMYGERLDKIMLPYVLFNPPVETFEELISARESAYYTVSGSIVYDLYTKRKDLESSNIFSSTLFLKNIAPDFSYNPLTREESYSEIGEGEQVKMTSFTINFRYEQKNIKREES